MTISLYAFNCGWFQCKAGFFIEGLDDQSYVRSPVPAYLIDHPKGRVLFDMSKPTALAVASAMNGEQLATLDELGKATITELANMITAQAVTKLHDLGFKFDLTPPALFTGENMEVSDHEVEALIVPMEIPQGKIEINVAIRERA